jgi:hypothetical protein
MSPFSVGPEELLDLLRRAEGVDHRADHAEAERRARGLRRRSSSEKM